jgi:hypothetical protein
VPAPAARMLLADQPAGDNPQTCCRCTCVIPSKPSPSCKGTPVPGCVAAPTYSKKQICKPGFLGSCDAVCLVNHGSWKAYNEC